MLFSKKCCALFLSCLILSVQAKTDCRDEKCKPGDDDLFYSIIGGAVVGGTAAVVAAPFVVSALGFNAGGIAAGSVGASMMSAMAPTAGGGVVATLQSVGVLGLSAGAKVGIGAAGAVVGAAIGAAVTDDHDDN
ncbi:PREDICTED: interferon alpha-inducible protein 27-like protein 2A [Amphimedon queenslandica]|uniref:Uncharacterized protein n=1 Tax=Amphimedon queenslandica TaxID=400682 RepID=A0A1X7ST81_AMPQE|nr:PREDICTED: interferon alpha-inducible protein 27-like protein 2A [Amphimedon queenslandica]|eukprot:XP_011408898.1 PREDICTED: interferon alpha-inducible protein 27-like protein 2A [Amphimedon queenslandica]